MAKVPDKVKTKGSTRRDGFTFRATTLEQRLFDYLYKQTPDGKRRDQMMRLMILGLIQELQIKVGDDDYIPPKQIRSEMDVFVDGRDDIFIGSMTPLNDEANGIHSVELDRSKDATVKKDTSPIVISPLKTMKETSINSGNRFDDNNNADQHVIEREDLMVVRTIKSVPRSLIVAL